MFSILPVQQFNPRPNIHGRSHPPARPRSPENYFRGQSNVSDYCSTTVESPRACCSEQFQRRALRGIRVILAEFSKSLPKLPNFFEHRRTHALRNRGCARRERTERSFSAREKRSRPRLDIKIVSRRFSLDGSSLLANLSLRR